MTDRTEQIQAKQIAALENVLDEAIALAHHEEKCPIRGGSSCNCWLKDARKVLAQLREENEKHKSHISDLQKICDSVADENERRRAENARLRKELSDAYDRDW